MKKISQCVFLSWCVIVLMGNSECMKKTRLTRSFSADEVLLRPAEKTPIDSQETRPSSAPVTTDEIRKAISQWKHLVPSEEQNEITRRINDTLKDAIIHVASHQHRQKMEALVNLICDPNIGKEYAYYVQNVYSCVAFEGCTSDNPYKYGRLLSAIGSDRGGGGGMDSALYWREYEDGFYDLCFDESLDI